MRCAERRGTGGRAMRKPGLRQLLAVVVMGFALAGAVAPAAAQEIAPEHLELARKYVDLTDRSKIYERTLAETAISTMQQLLPQNPQLEEPLGAAIDKAIEEYRTRRTDLTDQFARVYAIRMTQDELQQVVTFYESPVGQKLSAVNAAANQDMQVVLGVFAANLSQEFFARVRTNMREAGFDIGG